MTIKTIVNTPVSNICPLEELQNGDVVIVTKGNYYEGEILLVYGSGSTPYGLVGLGPTMCGEQWTLRSGLQVRRLVAGESVLLMVFDAEPCGE